MENKTLTDKVVEFLHKLADRSGTKFWVTAFGLFCMWDLAKIDKLNYMSGGFIIAAILLFLVCKYLCGVTGLNGDNFKKADKDR